MNKIILLDASPLGRISNPSATPANLECYEWLENLITSGFRVIVPEIADYEIRREILRAKKSLGIARLDLLKNTLDYLPLTTEVMLKSAELWAKARNQGKPTADPKALDYDVILAAQTLIEDGMIATENVGHLSLFVEAKDWHDISPVQFFNINVIENHKLCGDIDEKDTPFVALTLELEGELWTIENRFEKKRI